MKILSGIYKGRTIITPRGIRPVSVRLRKACFDILGQEIKGRRVLDLFGGSGSLGLEALSRNACEVVFVDKNKNCLKAIKANVYKFGETKRAIFYLKDALEAVKYFHKLKLRFDLIFLDPPYYCGMLTKTLQALQEYDIVTQFAYLVGFCYEKDSYYKENKTFSLIVSRDYGQSTLVIYRK